MGENLKLRMIVVIVVVVNSCAPFENRTNYSNLSRLFLLDSVC